METELNIKVGDRIVYFGDDLCRGTVRWLGNIEDICDGVTAGVELDEPCGTNSGAWRGLQLFACKKSHGIFIDLAGLMKLEDFGGAEVGDGLGRAMNGELKPDFENDPLFARLRQAIADGEPDEAAELAARLARMHPTKIQKEKPGDKEKPRQEKQVTDGRSENKSHQELRLDVEVEMKDGGTAEFQISIPDNFTVQMLMDKVEKDFGYNSNCQRWFFGENMISDISESVKEQHSLSPILYIRGNALPLADNGATKNAKNTSDPKKVKGEIEENPDLNKGWVCTNCTFVNEPARPGCAMCANERPDDYVVRTELEETFKKSNQKAEKEFLEKYEREQLNNYEKYLELDELQLILNNETFECRVCFTEIEPGDGVQLRECLHNFCTDCIKGTIINSETIPILCPYMDDDYKCQSVLQDREIANILSEEELQQYNNRCWAKAAGSTPDSYHCRTPDCKGWCVYEYGARNFPCPICGQTSCITCQAIHEGMDCKEYQDDLKLNAQNNEDARKTQEKIAEMVEAGTAMDCPGCGIIIMKTEGCDGMVCSHCRIEICWATKGRRWGPAGNGDLSGGCRCRAPPTHQICHPECRNCH